VSLAAAALASVASCATAAAADHPASVCADAADAAARLACYDRFFGAPGTASGPASAPLARDAAAASRAPIPVAVDPPSPLSRFWELGPGEKRGTFDVRTYRANYLLPVHYTSSLRVPSSPTHPAPTGFDGELQRLEAKFQVSLRTKAAEDVLLPGADLWLAYSQVSIWQIYNHTDSSPFRSSDYQPEAIFVVPVGAASGVRLPGDWRFRMVQLGVAHQSNGQGGALSRSWNRVWLGAGFDRDAIGVQLRLRQRVRFTSTDDNPDLLHYIGRAEVLASYLTPGTAATLTWRTGSGFVRRGSLQLDWSYPVRRARPDGLRWYVQAFTGYGETLLDYNHRQTSVGAGLALFQF
jgi:phospholipase A1